jgi:hypothetical protein
LVILAKEGKTLENDETTTTAQTTDSTNTDEPKLKNNIHSERERDFSFVDVCGPRTTHMAQPSPNPKKVKKQKKKNRKTKKCRKRVEKRWSD